MILLGSGIGFAFSLALKSDKGGILSAALLLFGVMTIWLPPVRAALFLYPLATISVLILLALIFKFAQAGGTVGLMTGGVLALLCHRRESQPTPRSGRVLVAISPRNARSPPSPALCDLLLFEPGHAAVRERRELSLPVAISSPRASNALGSRWRNPEIRRRRPVPPKGQKRPHDIPASDAGRGKADRD